MVIHNRRGGLKLKQKNNVLLLKDFCSIRKKGKVHFFQLALKFNKSHIYRQGKKIIDKLQKQRNKSKILTPLKDFL